MSKFAPQSADDISIATIRALAADVVAKANSGHPGAHPRLGNRIKCADSRLSSVQVLRWVWRLSPTSSSPGTCI